MGICEDRVGSQDQFHMHIPELDFARALSAYMSVCCFGCAKRILTPPPPLFFRCPTPVRCLPCYLLLE